MEPITGRFTVTNQADEVIAECENRIVPLGGVNEMLDVEFEKPDERILPIHEIDTMDDYLKNYGKILGKKAIHALAPLHVPGRDELPDFSDIIEFAPHREPFPAQGHVIGAGVKMLSTVGNGLIVGEMGTGKTILGMLTVHKHAQLSRKQGGSGGKYRALVLCPDHLIAKWCRELEETIPDAIVTRFGPQGGAEEKPVKTRRKKGEAKAEKPDPNSKATLKDVLRLFEKREGNRWSKPKGAEWFVLGRNQAKWLSDWAGMADDAKRFVDVQGALAEIAKTAIEGHLPDGTPFGDKTTYTEPMLRFAGARPNAVSSKNRPIDRVAVVDDEGRPKYDQFGRPIMQNITARVHYCPKCGAVVKDKKGVPVGKKDLTSGKNVAQKTCRATYLQMIPSGPDKKPHGLSRMRNQAGCDEEARFHQSMGKIGHEVNHGGYKWVVKECGEPLYNYTPRPYRWSPARILQKKCKRMFKYLLIDELHEQKSDESAQSMAAGKLIGSVDHVIGLTGTIIGGYANHLYPLMMRITPKSLREEGFEWGKDMAFSEMYGRIDRIVTIKEEDDECSVRGNVKSMRRAKSGNRSERKAVRPGVMPTMFGRHMIGSSIFITLSEMAEELPDLFEYVGGGLAPAPTLESSGAHFDDDMERWEKMKAGWHDTACDMEPDQEAEYKRVTAMLEFANKELLRKGSMKLLGAYLWTTLDYPDKPFGWDHDPEVKKALKLAQAAHEANPNLPAPPTLKHTVGYWDKPGDRSIENFVGVVTPNSLPEDRIYPKEQALIDICKKQKAEGRQTWVYVQMSGKRNIQPRLAKLLEAEGLKVGILRSDDVEPIEREDWIAKHGREFDVMISHPQLVSTGLDLFSKKQGGHNYSTLVFYETGYNLFTMAQAARRAWRIGQPLDCRVYYLYYKETMQHKAMSVMSRKKSALDAINGDFSEDGLAAMAGEDNLQMSLAKNLSQRINDDDMQRSWSKIKSGPKKISRPTAAITEMAKGAKASKLDHLPIELQIAAEALIESQGKPVPPEALAEFPKLHEEIKSHNHGFDADDANREFAEHEADIDSADDEEDEELPVSVKMEFEDEFDSAFDEEVSDDDIPELTEDILAKMFANMMEHGLMAG